ncbi:hypothetical protein I7I50_09272 [Histoplasma capsulatum G186AR]|uniref:Uncharacterized protein n=1 Tax=Ajellomyces capsulatus TaxID=5037 RepID=A0A8H7YS65_AJECA|nr:hypothetical protein I7I52_06793 [Histoplasma capsulatum]QSS74198.1 hypothetical protein I7I50_09272 [Histoplasma capsulatum G186AR]
MHGIWTVQYIVPGNKNSGDVELDAKSQGLEPNKTYLGTNLDLFFFLQSGRKCGVYVRNTLLGTWIDGWRGAVCG